MLHDKCLLLQFLNALLILLTKQHQMLCNAGPCECISIPPANLSLSSPPYLLALHASLFYSLSLSRTVSECVGKFVRSHRWINFSARLAAAAAACCCNLLQAAKFLASQNAFCGNFYSSVHWQPQWKAVGRRRGRQQLAAGRERDALHSTDCRQGQLKPSYDVGTEE